MVSSEACLLVRNIHAVDNVSRSDYIYSTDTDLNTEIIYIHFNRLWLIADFSNPDTGRAALVRRGDRFADMVH